MTLEDNLTASSSCFLLLKTSLVAFLVAGKPRSLSVSDAGAMHGVCFLPSQINERKKLVRRKMASSILLKRGEFQVVKGWRELSQ